MTQDQLRGLRAQISPARKLTGVAPAMRQRTPMCCHAAMCSAPSSFLPAAGVAQSLDGFATLSS